MAAEKERTAGEVMSSPVKTVGLDATIWEAADALRKGGVSGAPVVDGRGKPAGVFTLSDLAAYVLSTRGDFRVREFMTAGVVTVSPEATTSEVVETMRRNKVHRVFVAGADGQLAGVVTPLDLLGPDLLPAAPRKGQGLMRMPRGGGGRKA
ncbi:MAG: CBS domain-containing protein [Planctomycetes bacterium]|nr:CBS domain-containing protein [Planctomycetota bacterium]